MAAPHRKHLKRGGTAGFARYLTFSCQSRLPLFTNAKLRDLFAESLSKARQRCEFRLLAWVVMPEHVHVMLIPTSDEWSVAKTTTAIKAPVAIAAIRRWRELKAPVLSRITMRDGRTRFWQAGGGFDRNIRDESELLREIEYIHHNPIKRGLVGAPTEWAWSSAAWYAGLSDARLPIDVVNARWADYISVRLCGEALTCPERQVSGTGECRATDLRFGRSGRLG